jgi:hypothetical protein
MSEENVNILRQGYDAFNRADIDTVMVLMDPKPSPTTSSAQ